MFLLTYSLPGMQARFFPLFATVYGRQFFSTCSSFVPFYAYTCDSLASVYTLYVAVQSSTSCILCHTNMHHSFFLSEKEISGRRFLPAQYQQYQYLILPEKDIRI